MKLVVDKNRTNLPCTVLHDQIHAIRNRQGDILISIELLYIIMEDETIKDAIMTQPIQLGLPIK